MNENTGEIREFASTIDAKRAGFTRSIPLEERPKVQGMTRLQRRQWAAELRASERDSAHRSAKKYKARQRVSR